MHPPPHPHTRLPPTSFPCLWPSAGRWGHWRRRPCCCGGVAAAAAAALLLLRRRCCCCGGAAAAAAAAALPPMEDSLLPPTRSAAASARIKAGRRMEESPPGESSPARRPPPPPYLLRVLLVPCRRGRALLETRPEPPVSPPLISSSRHRQSSRCFLRYFLPGCLFCLLPGCLAYLQCLIGHQGSSGHQPTCLLSSLCKLS